jgi:hypothetical protein
MKYIVETLGIFRQMHVVEAANKEEALAIADKADDNWQEFLGQMKIDINEYSEEQIAHYKKKDYFWNGVAFHDEKGNLHYKDENGIIR